MQNNCWNQIGVWGERTCLELDTVTHCRNCSVYSQAGRGLLERPAPEGYVAEWTALLSQPRSQRQMDHSAALSLSIFRLGREWLALPADIFKRVLSPNPVHSLPHRSNRVLRGIVNVRGQLLLCVSLHELLGVAATEPDSAPAIASQSVSASGQPGSYPRLAVIEQQQDIWAFEVNELYGLHRCQPEDLRNAPALSSKALESFTQSILPWRNQNVSCLNADYLLETLRQQAL